MLSTRYDYMRIQVGIGWNSLNISYISTRFHVGYSRIGILIFAFQSILNTDYSKIILYTYLYQHKVNEGMDNCDIINIFTNFYITIRIYLIISIVNCIAERAFSKLARIKNKNKSCIIYHH